MSDIEAAAKRVRELRAQHDAMAAKSVDLRAQIESLSDERFMLIDKLRETRDAILVASTALYAAIVGTTHGEWDALFVSKHGPAYLPPDLAHPTRRAREAAESAKYQAQRELARAERELKKHEAGDE
jgi:hypothetical protein